MGRLLRKANRTITRLQRIITRQQTHNRRQQEFVTTFQDLCARQEAALKELNEQFEELQIIANRQQELLGYLHRSALGVEEEEDKDNSNNDNNNNIKLNTIGNILDTLRRLDVDFEAVRMECDICSKGAAYVSNVEESSPPQDPNCVHSAKRYERMMKAHGIYQTSSTIADTAFLSSKNKTTAATATSNSTAPSSSKKRKQAQFVETNSNTDDDEGLGKVKSESPIKKIKGEMVQDEPHNKQARLNTVDVQQLPVHPDGLMSAKEETAVESATDLGNTDDSATFRDFLAFGAFSGQDAESWAIFDANTSLDEKPVKDAVPESKSIVPASITITE
ncbi:hypothetical protein N7G274_005555 [Stereocaulon virgatum]|uniref:Uncharacterized protein n=1 Tax=Stereocaulon virgatum TaxID=373712 RepID=A0ABR4A8N0_9LECA